MSAGGPPWLKRRAVEMIARHGVLLVSAAWVLSRVAMLLMLGRTVSVDARYQMAGAWLEHGTLPFGSPLDAPPGAFLMLVLPRVLTATAPAYAHVLAIE